MTTTLLTGASSGIGLELAKLFAAGGDNVVLTFRIEGKLDELENVYSSCTTATRSTFNCSISRSTAPVQISNWP